MDLSNNNRWREIGNEQFKKQQYRESIESYSKAIEQSLDDAEDALKINNSWDKAQYRKSIALKKLGRLNDSLLSLEKYYQTIVKTTNTTTVNQFKKEIQDLKKELIDRYYQRNNDRINSDVFDTISVKYIDCVKGKGVFLNDGLKSIQKNSIIFKERPLVSHISYRFLKEKELFKLCSYCFSMIHLDESLFKSCGGKSVYEISVNELKSVNQSTVNCSCNEVYCSLNCKQLAWNEFHRVLCPSNLELKSLIDQYYEKAILGQEVYISGSSKTLGGWVDNDAIKLRYGDNGDWEILIEFDNREDYQDNVQLQYKYFIMDTNGDKIWESGPNRTINLKHLNSSVINEFRDTYQSPTSPENTYLATSFFREVLFRRNPEDFKGYTFLKSTTKDKVIIHFQVKATLVPPHHAIYIVGSNTTLGNWRTDRAIRLSDESYPLWKVDLEFTKEQLPFSYKYIIADKAKSYVHWEEGSDRWFTSSIVHSSDYASTKNEERDFYFNDGDFKDSHIWRTTGVAIPVFSIRTRNGLGVGEFNDIKTMVDWAVETGLHMIQILPINDTTVYYTWRDSYPYSAVSVYALHPIYINIDSMTKDVKILEKTKLHREKFNQLPTLDYDEVMNIKLQLLNEIYQLEKNSLEKNSEFLEFLEDNQHWIKEYALYCVLRDTYKTADYTNWPKYKSITQDDILRETSPKSEYFDKIRYHYFVQYHLHRQLLSASQYAVSKRVGLKGDLPIGVNRLSVEAWAHPDLFRMNMSTGAPPDAFSDDGQNWGFPTYDWDRMKKDDYKWWRSRLGQMSKYFHAFRIDHILGFFRIWEIPTTCVTGLLGKFNPSIPLWKSELSNNGIWDIDRLTKPYIRYHTLREQFGEFADDCIAKFLKEDSPNCYSLIPEFSTEKNIEKNLQQNDSMYKPGLYKLVQNVCLINDPEDDIKFYPRIEITKTSSFNELSDDIKSTLYRLYISYYFERQEELWAQTALQRLPLIKNCTKMLVCGEDLGMVPKCVEPVLRDLGILGLRIQRMPSDSNKDFYHPSEYSYLTVNTTSSHDMSTLRGFWEEDRTRSQVFYNKILGMYGEAPYFCEPYVSDAVITQHLHSPSMLTILPLQDWFGLSSELSKRDPKEEKINEPSNPIHYWRYRMNIYLEDILQNNSEFNKNILRLVTASNRKLDL
eukprot:gene9919-12163_t